MNPIKYLNGLGLVASEPRNIRPGNEYNKFFGPPKRQDKYLSYAGTTNDTIEFMADIIKSTLDDTKRIAPVLKGKDLRRTLSNIFSFIFNHIQYKPDDPRNEELRRPNRAWADRSTGVDCDCYSILIGSILSNLNIPFALRMVKINNKPYFQHVYVVVPNNGQQSALRNRGDYYTVDPVLDTFNEEHPFTGKYDLFMQPIKYLNGVPSASLNGLQGGTVYDDNVYYSPEAAQETRDGVVFFDGLDYYQRVDGFDGLNGLSGLGFLSKVFKVAKGAFKVVKKIGKKAIKKVGKIFKGNPQKKAERKLRRATRKEERRLRKLQKSNAPMQPMTSLPPSVTPIGNSAVTPQSMISIAKNMDKSLGVDSILNVAKAIMPDNKVVNELIDAKSKANAGISSMEARMMVNDAAKANKGLSTMEARLLAKDAAKAEMLDNMQKQPTQPMQAGFGFGGMNTQTMLMLGLGVLTAGMVFMNRPKAA